MGLLNTSIYFFFMISPHFCASFKRTRSSNSRIYAVGATSGHEAYANQVGFAAVIALLYGQIAGETAVAELK